MLKLSIFLTIFTALTVSNAEIGKSAISVIQHPNKNEYAAILPGSDKHKYGYEVNENRQFHHTTTEEDGVRLGCYGHIQDGKVYSTQYVADARGYRPIHTYDLITVYPKNGPERKASFVGEFNEDERLTQNIRYFFPEACRGLESPSPPTPTPSTTPSTTTSTTPSTTPPTTSSTTSTTTTRKTTKPPTTPFYPPPPVQTPCKDSCCDENRPQLVLPIPMQNGQGRSDSCGMFGKLTIPFEGMDSDMLKSMTYGADVKVILKSILQNLS